MAAGKEVPTGEISGAVLLRGHYIHQSAHWMPSIGVLVNKPAENDTRNVYPNQPQKDYPV
ncbi:hypothetical protein [Pseudomonas sp. JG-B]|uniref:hypothetical protein n=1 Tax=Pseudomonas sp. JG-B TaxID=2603214 RepID=UPI00129D3CDF|nr:hypothetical protein [Pseudomonas sp. JG-B]MRK20681.1 hypothetical protein [Pseudomonas sp. JG-B]